jgi:formylglycine-generating enzyme required for sulfatase activity
MAPLTLEEYKAQLMPIPAGSFKREGFTITLSAFQMGRTPVTVGMWQEYAAARGLKMPKPPNFPVWADGWNFVRDHPMVSVSWEDCKAYADWAGLLLPTEAQWEFASRGGLIDKEFPWGDEEPSDQLWSWRTSRMKGTGPVERSNNFFINGYGLCDIVGNVWEWCSDWHGDYSMSNETDPTGVAKGIAHILRGGSWNNGAGDFCCAYRNWQRPYIRGSIFGFRLSSPAPR